ncbi:MAG: hypothetical protein RL458_3445, partial [Pseudomonadota bacterium]
MSPAVFRLIEDVLPPSLAPIY